MKLVYTETTYISSALNLVKQKLDITFGKIKIIMDPNNLKYTKDHEWISIDGDYAFVGITNFAQKELGDIVFVEIESLEQEIKSGEVFGSVEAVKTVSDLFMPMTGEIIEVNQKIIDNPELVNSDPYGEGWMIKIKIFDSNEVEDLLDLKSYEEISG